jgi:bifunctional aspartokinase / homoserine dehydrogenase 1
VKQKKSNGIIMKYGGTSVGSPESIEQIIAIVSSSQAPIAGVVVSAFAGVTNQLVEAAQSASEGREDYLEKLQQVRERHVDAIASLIPSGDLQREAAQRVTTSLSELESVMMGVYLIRELTAKTMDVIMSYGERLSACIIAQSFRSQDIAAEYVDARKLVLTDGHFGAARVHFDKTYKNIVDFYKQSPDCLKIVTGFIGSTEAGETTTLGRGGSDYTAALFGAALDVEAIEIWTDVDGVLTADPRKVKTAFTVPAMTYQEAMEMSHFGAKVIYPPTMIPALNKKIPLVIRNTFNPEFVGTVIGETAPDTFPIRGISSIENISVLLLQGSGLIGIPGTVMRLFGALAKHNISMIFITQASSEHTICFAIDPKLTRKAKAAIDEEFRYEMRDEIIDPLNIEEHLSIIAIVGENMRRKVGISGQLFTALADSQVNVVAIAQGSSERNISVIVANREEKKALNAIHKTFFEGQGSGDKGQE